MGVLLNNHFLYVRIWRHPTETPNKIENNGCLEHQEQMMDTEIYRVDRADMMVLRQATQFCFSAGLAAPFLRRPTTMGSCEYATKHTGNFAKISREASKKKLIFPIPNFLTFARLVRRVLFGCSSCPQNRFESWMTELDFRSKCSPKNTRFERKRFTPCLTKFWAPNLDLVKKIIWLGSKDIWTRQIHLVHNGNVEYFPAIWFLEAYFPEV